MSDTFLSPRDRGRIKGSLGCNWDCAFFICLRWISRGPEWFYFSLWKGAGGTNKFGNLWSKQFKPFIILWKSALNFFLRTLEWNVINSLKQKFEWMLSDKVTGSKDIQLPFFPSCFLDTRIRSYSYNLFD